MLNVPNLVLIINLSFPWATLRSTFIFHPHTHLCFLSWLSALLLFTALLGLLPAPAFWYLYSSPSSLPLISQDLPSTVTAPQLALSHAHLFLPYLFFFFFSFRLPSIFLETFLSCLHGPVAAVCHWGSRRWVCDSRSGHDSLAGQGKKPTPGDGWEGLGHSRWRCGYQTAILTANEDRGTCWRGFKNILGLYIYSTYMGGLNMRMVHPGWSISPMEWSKEKEL